MTDEGGVLRWIPLVGLHVLIMRFLQMEWKKKWRETAPFLWRVFASIKSIIQVSAGRDHVHNSEGVFALNPLPGFPLEWASVVWRHRDRTVVLSPIMHFGFQLWSRMSFDHLQKSHPLLEVENAPILQMQINIYIPIYMYVYAYVYMLCMHICVYIYILYKL